MWPRVAGAVRCSGAKQTGKREGETRAASRENGVEKTQGELKVKEKQIRSGQLATCDQERKGRESESRVRRDKEEQRCVGHDRERKRVK